MKKFIPILLIISLVSCTTVYTVNAPPGQVKKMTGSKSAKPYAPGQQKKAGGKPGKGHNK